MTPNQIEQFEQFWKSYPRRIGKGAARKAFEKALKLASFEEVMTGLHRQIPITRAESNNSSRIRQHGSTKSDGQTIRSRRESASAAIWPTSDEK